MNAEEVGRAVLERIDFAIESMGRIEKFVNLQNMRIDELERRIGSKEKKETELAQHEPPKKEEEEEGLCVCFPEYEEWKEMERKREESVRNKIYVPK